MSAETKPKKALPVRELTFQVGVNDYKTEYPNTGQFLQIETLKQSITRNTYDSLGSTVSSQIARYTTDMIAFLTVCCPEMKKDLKVETFSDLSMMDSKKLLRVYIDTILPWITEWEIILNSDEEQE